MFFSTFRRYYLDCELEKIRFSGVVLDIGGKKHNKRGRFRPLLENVIDWKYLNTDASTQPDYCCSAENIPIESSSFDYVLMTEVLEHLRNPETVLAESFRILKTNGAIVATMPFLYAIHADPDDYQRWTPTKIRMEFSSCGFTNIIIQPMGSLFSVIYDLIYVSLGSTKKPTSFDKKLIRKTLFPLLRILALYLDERMSFVANKLTTGYLITATKINL